MNDLQSKFDLFVSKQLASNGSSLREFLVKHREKIRVGTTIAKACKSFVVDKTPLAFVEGAFNVLDGIASINSEVGPSLFSNSNGWKKLFDDSTDQLLIPALQGLPHRSVSFKYDHSNAKIYSTSVGEIVILGSASKRDYYTQFSGIYYKFNESNHHDVINFLVKGMIARLNSNILSLNVENKHTISLTGEPIDYNESKRLDSFVEYLGRCSELNINRSFLFIGPPGTGKSSLAQSIVSKLKLRTLVYKDSSYDHIESFYFIIEKFGIQAVILDDFDQVNHSNKLLKMLERINKEVKLVIGLVNSMSEFHPAVIRPDRFDEIKKIDAIDEDVVRKELGSLSELYFDKVCKWPIAYIKELFVRSQLYPAEELEVHYNELNERVAKQLKDLSNKSDSKATAEP